MPCKACKEIFMHNPCQETTEIKIAKDVFDRQLYDYFHEAFKTKCPCKECLIKTVCYRARMECSNYSTFLRSRDA
jgi:hypothetical protein